MEESFLDKKELAFRGMAEYLEPELVQDLLFKGKFEGYCEEFYRFMDQMTLPVAWKDIEGKYMGGVKLFYETAGLSCREDLIGKTDTELIWKAHAHKFSDAAKETLASQEHVSFDAKLKVAYGDGFDYFQINHKNISTYNSSELRGTVVSFLSHLRDFPHIIAELDITEEEILDPEQFLLKQNIRKTEEQEKAKKTEEHRFQLKKILTQMENTLKSICLVIHQTETTLDILKRNKQDLALVSDLTESIPELEIKLEEMKVNRTQFENKIKICQSVLNKETLSPELKMIHEANVKRYE